MGEYSFPQANNLEFIYQFFTELDDEGLNRYSFGEKYNMHDRQGAYYLNALCFIGLAEKKGLNTFLSERGAVIQKLSEPFRKKVFLLAIFENQFICDTYQVCKNKDKSEQAAIIEILIEGTYGIHNEAMKQRRARTLISWFHWIQQQEFYIEEKYNE